LFGTSVSISGTIIAAGAPGAVSTSVDTGAAYVFENTGTWAQTKKLTGADSGKGDNFGHSICVSGDFVVVGAPQNAANGGNSGCAYVFSHDTSPAWGQLRKVTGDDESGGFNFGWSVTIYDGFYVIVGAYGAGTGSSGVAYVFWRSQDGPDMFGQVSKFIAFDTASSDNYGYSVSISPSYILIGSPLDDDKGSSSGSAYVYQRMFMQVACH